MIKTIYQRAIAVLMKKPIRLWAIGLLGAVLVGFLSLLGGFVPIIGIILTTPAQIGLLLVYLHGYRGEEIYSAQMLEVYEKKDDTWKRLVIGMLWKDLWVFIWALIPIAGIVLAIIKAYQYRLTPYILAQEPEVKPTDAIRLSKERTKGYVGAMFGADILPYLAVGIVAMILGALARIRYIGWLFGIVLFVLVVACVLFMRLFLGLVGAAFYEELMHPTMPAPGAQAGGEKVFCPQCGAAVDKGTAFCPSCGAKIEQ